MTTKETDPTLDADQLFHEKLEVELQRLVGVKFKTKGDTMDGVDCSGLVYLAWKNAGRPIPRHDVNKLRLIYWSGRHHHDAQAHDLLFWEFYDYDNGDPYLHVGIHAGHGEFYHATNNPGGSGVKKDRIEKGRYWDLHFIGSGRIEWPANLQARG